VGVPTRSRPRVRGTKRRFSSVSARNLRDEGTQTVVSPAESELVRALAELHMGCHTGDVLPRNTHAAASADPRGEAAHQSGACAPDAGATHDRDDLQLFSRAALERKVIDVAAPALLRVQQLMVEDVQTEIDRVAQFWPTFVRIISGIAVNEMIRMTTR
jgi:hypothetical protein